MNLIIILFTALFQPMSLTMNDHSGNWEFSVNTPDGTYSGVIVLKKSFDTYEGHLSAQGTKYELTDIVVDGDDLNFNFTFQGIPIQVKGSVAANTYSGVISAEGMQIPLEAKRTE